MELPALVRTITRCTADSTKQEDPTHTVSYLGRSSKALRESLRLVEKGRPPALSTTYEVLMVRWWSPPTAAGT